VPHFSQCGDTYLVPARNSRMRFFKASSAGERGLASSQRSKSCTRTTCSISGCFTLTEIGVAAASVRICTVAYCAQCSPGWFFEFAVKERV